MRKFFLVSFCLLLLGNAISAQEIFFPFQDSWKYLDNGTDQGTAWRAPLFDDAAWKTGNGKFGYGITDANTIISYGPDSKKKYITTYFRKTFTMTNPSAYPLYNVFYKRDDGIVIYVNGVEVFRNNLPAGTIGYDTLASSASDDGYTIRTFNISNSAFVSGSNVIAVEIHQQKGTSSDLAFDMKLTAPDQVRPTVVSFNHQNPLTTSTAGSSVTYRMTFSEPVTGVGRADFTMVTTGTVAGTLSNNAVKKVDFDGAIYDVTVNSITGAGTLRLDLKSSATGIEDLIGNVILNGGYIGPVYNIDRVAPSALSINRQVPPTQNTTDVSLTYRVSFSEPVSGVDVTDFSLATLNGDASGVLEPNAVVPVGTTGDVYDVTVSNVLGSGELRLDLDSTGTGIRDTLNNAIAGGFYNGQVYTVRPADVAAPTVISINRYNPLEEATTATSLTYRVTFSEPVVGVDVTDFSLTTTGSANGIINGLVPADTEGIIYDITVGSLTGSGTLRIDLKALNTNIQDATGNILTGGFTTGQTYSIADVVAPTVLAITRQQPLSASTTLSSLVFRVSFSERVMGVDVADFTLTTVSGNATGSITSVTPTDAYGNIYDVVVSSVSGTGVLRLDLNAAGTGIVDAVNNSISGGFNTGETYNIDRVAPSVLSINRQNPLTEQTTATSLVYRITFSEAVTGLDVTDFTLTTVSGTVGGTLNPDALAPVDPGGTSYDVTVSSVSGAGRLRLDLNGTGTGIKDGFGNDIVNGFNSGQTYLIQDLTAPFVNSINRQSPAAYATSGNMVVFRVTFSETVLGVNSTDFSLVTTSTAAGTIGTGAVVPVGTDGDIFDVTVSSIIGTGTLRLDLKSTGTGITDQVGNAIAGGFSGGQVYVIDHTPPSVVSINRQVPLNEITSTSTVVFRVTFTEDVTGVDPTDFSLTLTGSANGTLASDAVALVNTDGSTFIYDVTVSSVAGTGTLRLDLKGTGTNIIDVAGNTVSSGFTSGQSYTIDQAPMVVSIRRQLPTASSTTANSVTFRVTFSKKVTGVDQTDFIVKGVTGNARGTLVHLANETQNTTGTDAITPVGTTGAVYDVMVRALAGSGALRLDLRSSGTSIMDVDNNPIAGGFTSGETYNIQPPEGHGFSNFTVIDPMSIASHTADKPQAKLWTYAGKWWAVLPVSGGTKIFRLDGTAWTPVLTIASQTTTKADCIVAGNLTHILLFRSGDNDSYVVSVEYDPSTTSYKLWSQRTTKAVLRFGIDTETASATLDGNGRMWVAYDGLGDVSVRWSDAPYGTWSTPIRLASGADPDDICAIVALPGKIGVLWSDQTRKRFGFKTHTNGASPATWSADEEPASQSAQNIGRGFADDHLNMVCSSNGTLYCAVKTGYDMPGKPKLVLLVRRPTGTWDNAYSVTANEGTRGIIVLNETLGKLRYIYSSLEGGEDILYRETSTSTIAFGPPITIFGGNSDIVYNYSSSTHQICNSEVVILAADLSTDKKVASILGSDNLPAGSVVNRNGSTSEEQIKAPESIELSKEPSLLVFPNPMVKTATVSFNLPEAGDYTLSLYNNVGQLETVLARGSGTAGRQSIQMDGSSLKPGIYLVRLATSTTVTTYKLIVRK